MGPWGRWSFFRGLFACVAAGWRDAAAPWAVLWAALWVAWEGAARLLRELQRPGPEAPPPRETARLFACSHLPSQAAMRTCSPALALALALARRKGCCWRLWSQRAARSRGRRRRPCPTSCRGATRAPRALDTHDAHRLRRVTLPCSLALVLVLALVLALVMVLVLALELELMCRRAGVQREDWEKRWAQKKPHPQPPAPQALFSTPTLPTPQRAAPRLAPVPVAEPSQLEPTEDNQAPALPASPAPHLPALTLLVPRAPVWSARARVVAEDG